MFTIEYWIIKNENNNIFVLAVQIIGFGYSYTIYYVFLSYFVIPVGLRSTELNN